MKYRIIMGILTIAVLIVLYLVTETNPEEEKLTEPDSTELNINL
jgi:hypothetical protein